MDDPHPHLSLRLARRSLLLSLTVRLSLTDPFPVGNELGETSVRVVLFPFGFCFLLLVSLFFFSIRPLLVITIEI